VGHDGGRRATLDVPAERRQAKLGTAPPVVRLGIKSRGNLFGPLGERHSEYMIFFGQFIVSPQIEAAISFVRYGVRPVVTKLSPKLAHFPGIYIV
jgi:hypothetical protein